MDISKTKDELIEEIVQIEPDVYDDWSVEELQELALFLGIELSWHI